MYSSTIIPNRGAWLEYETDSNDIVSVRIDRTRKLPATTLIRALGYHSNHEILSMFGEDEKLIKTLDKDATVNQEEGLIEIYKKLRPGEPPTVESARNLINSLFFDEKRYDLAKVGRYKFNKKLGVSNRIEERVAAENIINPQTGEILVEKDSKITIDMAAVVENAGVKQVDVYGNDDKVVRVIGNQFVNIHNFIDSDKIKIKEKVYYPVLKEILDTCDTLDEQLHAIEERMFELVPRHIVDRKSVV